MAKDDSTHIQFRNDNDLEIATLANGCFWCTEAIFSRVKGIKSVISGYSGGKTSNPSYEQVCTGITGHAEAIQIEYDPKIISFEKILDIFWHTHDPTTLNRQGNDVGTQYRSAIFYHDESQKNIAEKSKIELEKEGVFKNPIVTEIIPF
jgi:peptide-methionine (S)-S-oxide reductase